MNKIQVEFELPTGESREVEDQEQRRYLLRRIEEDTSVETLLRRPVIAPCELPQ